MMLAGGDSLAGDHRLIVAEDLPMRGSLLRFAQLAEIFRHGVGVALRDGLSAGVADGERQRCRYARENASNKAIS